MIHDQNTTERPAREQCSSGWLAGQRAEHRQTTTTFVETTKMVLLATEHPIMFSQNNGTEWLFSDMLV